MNIQPDFEELLRLLEENKVEYLIVGGFAVAYHGYPRFTKDIDIFFHATGGNIQKLRRALLEFGFMDSELPQDLFQKEGNIVTFGAEPVRVDMMNVIDGVDFQTAWMNRQRGTYGKTKVNFIGRNELIRNKESTSRAQDKADAEKLSGKP
ncbi:MAG: nucleotidyltransferase [Spirochaetales bacterium]|nr:nucleotidyltransferase [Spirochaetales bacterium]